MIKILASGVRAEYNFGTPSIMHGFEEMLNQLYGNDYKLIVVQQQKTNPTSISDFKMSIVHYPYSTQKLICEVLKYKVFRGLSTTSEGELVKLILDSDIVVDLYGILYCDQLNKNDYGILKSSLNAIGFSGIEFAAHILGKKTIKHTSSFGPMNHKSNRRAAHFASKHIFTHMIARENQSRQTMIKDAKVTKEVFLSPDVANLFSIKNIEKTDTIGISVSHKIKSEWKNSDSYIDCMVQLCKHISNEYHRNIYLIPNEFDIRRANDIVVAEEIQKRLKEQFNIETTIPDVIHINSTQLKELIGSCELIIASRYHTCVAALSLGIPLIMLGWHYKYQELAEHYGQQRWVLPTEKCSIQSLIEIFDSFYQQRESIKDEIKAHYPKVKEEILEVGRMLYIK